MTPPPGSPFALADARETPVDQWSESAFEAVFLTFYPRLVGMLCRMLGDRGRSEELASDTLMRLAARQVPLERYESLSGWLYRTAANLGIDALRAGARRRHYEQLAPAADSRPTPLEELLRHERAHQVRSALARLKPAQAQLLVLRSHGLSYQEIADALQIKPASVGTLLARAEVAFEQAYQRLRRSAAREVAATAPAAESTKESR